MDKPTASRQSHEHMYQSRRLADFFEARSRRDEVLFKMPRLLLGDCDPRARAREVYVMSESFVRTASSGA